MSIILVRTEQICKQRSSFALGSISSKQAYAFAIDAEGDLPIKAKLKRDRVLGLLGELEASSDKLIESVSAVNVPPQAGVFYAINFKSPSVDLTNLKDYQEKMRLVFAELNPVFVDKDILKKIDNAHPGDLPTLISEISADLFKVQREKRIIGASVQNALDQKDPSSPATKM